VVEVVLTSWPALLLLLVALRFLPGVAMGETPWRRRSEVALALGLGLLFAFLSCTWFSRFYLTGPTLSSDFYDFCSAVSNYRADDIASFSQDRSFLAAWLPAKIAENKGVVDGLGWTAVISMVVLGVGLYTWGRALHSRWAGAYTLVAALTIAPLVILGRTLTFYPEYVAVFSLSAGLVCLAIRFSNWLNLLLASASIGLCLLIDVRGVVWAVPSFFALCLVYLPLGWKKGMLHGAILWAVLGTSWWAGRLAYTSDSTSLDDQSNPVRLYNEHKDFGRPLMAEPGPNDIPNLVWGRTPIQDIPKTLLRLTKDTKKIAPLLSDAKRTKSGRENHFHPWYPVLIPFLLLSLVGIRKSKPRILGLVVTSLPFAAVLYHASTLEFTARFASSAMPPFAVIIGLGVAVLWGNPNPSLPLNAAHKESHPIKRHLPNFVRMGVLLSLAWGLIPSYLSPRADWRVTFTSDHEINSMRTGALGGKMPEAWGSEACVEGIRADWKSGLKPLGKLYY
jgi:hypothetical protein